MVAFLCVTHRVVMVFRYENTYCSYHTRVEKRVPRTLRFLSEIETLFGFFGPMDDDDVE